MIGTLLIGIMILVSSSVIVNYYFGHSTFHATKCCASTKSKDRIIVTSSTDRSTPPPSTTQQRQQNPPKGGTSMQQLPRDLLVGDILSYLTPYEVIVLAQASKFCRHLSDSTRYWYSAWRHVTAAAFALHGGEVKEIDGDGEAEGEGGMSMSGESGGGGNGGVTKGGEGGEMGGGGRGEGEEEGISKMEYFRRMFVLPYHMSNGHDTAESCRVIVHGKVYDVTKFLANHPGGDLIMLEYAAVVDASHVFELSYHSTRAREMMNEWLVWDPVPFLGRQGILRALVKRAGGGDGRRPIIAPRIRREGKVAPEVVQVLEAIRFTR